MANYYWHPAAMTDPLVLPAAVTDRCLTIAAPEQLRVLLWLSRHRMVMDTAACADAVGITPAECDGCLRFWEEQGILCAAPTVSVEELPAVQTADSAVQTRPLGRPAAVKPLVGEVLEYQRKNPDFATFLGEVSARLGKAITHSDTATLLYLHHTVGLPQEVILTEVAYAVSIGKGSLHYVEQIALGWAERELTTLEAVDDHIRHLEACRRAAEKLETLLSLPRPLNILQAETAEKWYSQWHFSDAMLKKAYEYTVDKIGKFSCAYMDKVLDSWRAEGIDRPEKIPVFTPKKKGAAATNPEESSLDLDGLDEQLMRYTPVFRKKGG